MLTAQNRPKVFATVAAVGATLALISLAIVYGQGSSSSSTSPYGSRQVALQASPQVSPGASPEASLIAGGQPQSAVTLQMVDIGFSLPEFTVPANSDVTITAQNTGQLPHTFVINDHNNPDVQNLDIEVDVDPGETGMTTVNAPPGDYYYHCRLPGHEGSGMHGIMHVQ